MLAGSAFDHRFRFFMTHLPLFAGGCQLVWRQRVGGDVKRRGRWLK